jgi:ATP-dependent RNA helicase SUPV3L1/SUV3
MHSPVACITGRSIAKRHLLQTVRRARSLRCCFRGYSQTVALSRYRLHPEHESREDKDSSKLFFGHKRFTFRDDDKKTVTEKDSRVRPFKAIQQRLQDLKEDLRKRETYKPLGISEKQLEKLLDKFWDEITLDFQAAAAGGATRTSKLVEDLTMAYHGEFEYPLWFIVKIEFFKRVMRAIFPAEQLETQKKMAGFQYPQEWFPQARSMKRVIHLHVGPTNSGKTYQALKRLEQVQGLGTYLGPLRLLAQEIYTRMNNRGLPTFLITGDERQAPTIAVDASTVSRVSSCTVEMANLQTEHEVAVIDEIQMIADEERGFAWTIALLGLRAKELHLCGEERAVPIIEMLARSLGEELHIHQYSRLSPLQVAGEHLVDLKNLEKGDCVVCFSVHEIHSLRRHIEQVTNRKVAIVYGKLPSEIRLQQAELFNDPNNEYDILVASNAIGMGLNLLVFCSLMTFLIFLVL